MPYLLVFILLLFKNIAELVLKPNILPNSSNTFIDLVKYLSCVRIKLISKNKIMNRDYKKLKVN